MAEEINFRINEWILQYSLHETWREFTKNKCLSKRTLNIVSGLINVPYGNVERVNEMRLFLLVLCRIHDGEHPMITYCDIEGDREDEQLTPWEDLLVHWSSLVNMQVDDDIIMDGKILMNPIKMQAVLACLRAEEKEMAYMVYNRQFADVDKTNKVFYWKVKNLKSLIELTDTDTLEKSEKRYKHFVEHTDFVDLLIKYLSRIFEYFQKPLLIMAANMLMKMDCSHGDGRKHGQEQGDRDSHPKSKKFRRESLEAFAEHSSNRVSPDSATPRKQLKKLWDQNTKEIYGSHEKPSSSSCSSTPKKKVPHLSKPSTSMTNFSSPKKMHPPSRPSTSITNSTPSRPSTSRTDRPTTTSPGMQYKRNVGRPDRHKPVEESSFVGVSDMDDNMSLMSMSTARKKWTHEETAAFYHAVSVTGVGRWAQIKEYLGTERSGVQLKDKWRNMVKNNEVEEFKRLARKGKKS